MPRTVGKERNVLQPARDMHNGHAHCACRQRHAGPTSSMTVRATCMSCRYLHTTVSRTSCFVEVLDWLLWKQQLWCEQPRTCQVRYRQYSLREEAEPMKWSHKRKVSCCRRSCSTEGGKRACSTFGKYVSPSLSRYVLCTPMPV
jgi:hypothetical protein